MDEAATMAMPALAPLPEAPSAGPERESAEAEPEPQAEPPRAPVETDSSAAHASGPQDPVDTKLELAQAYLEMGDAEGAQHMLDEVMNEGDSRQKAEALRLREQAGPAQRRA
ncbi:MAG TPA: FimV/HubP family polar landmark protein [Planctomycetota bacterium]|nr:FimV/HubP family polar landmark protein [Planctomycetota bacterium]